MLDQCEQSAACVSRARQLYEELDQVGARRAFIISLIKEQEERLWRLHRDLNETLHMEAEWRAEMLFIRAKMNE